MLKDRESLEGTVEPRPIEVKRNSDPFTEQFETQISKKLEKILTNKAIEKILDEIQNVEDSDLKDKMRGTSQELERLKGRSSAQVYENNM